MAINSAALSLVHPGLGASIAGFLPDTARVLRRVVTPPTPVTTLDFGYGPTPVQNADLANLQEIASVPCALAEYRTSDGKQAVIVDAVESIVPWRVKFRATPGLDVRVGDVLEIRGRGFKVIIAPIVGSFGVLCSANCQEIESS